MKIQHLISNSLFAFSFLSFGVFFFPKQYLLFGSIGWFALIVLMFLRPLADIFPKGNIFAKMMFLRKSLGVLSGMFILAHGIGFFLERNLSLPSSLFLSEYWSLDTLYGWGMFGILLLLPLLVTSNTFSIKLLGKWWKPLQRLSYLFFLVGAIHVAFAQKSIVPLIIFSIWLICWIIAEVKQKEKPVSSVLLSLICIPTLAAVFPQISSHETTLPEKESITENTSVVSNDVQENDVQENEEVAETKTLTISSKCIGCGKCIRIDSSHFSWSSSGRKATPISQDNLNSSGVSRAISACPVSAISII